MNSKKKRAFGVIAAVIIVLLAVIFISFLLDSQGGETPIAGDAEESQLQSQSGLDIWDTIWFQGNEYRYNNQLLNVLFLGIDAWGTLEDSENQRPGIADAILLVSLDAEKEQAQVLNISRDILTEVNVFNRAGQVTATKTTQLGLQHGYGLGGLQSSRAMVNTVSNVLYGIPIDGFIALNVDSVALLNDAIGGVTMVMPADYSYIDPDFYAGARVVFTGAQAERFVQFRDITVPGSNQDRMRRQNYFVLAFFQSLRTEVDGSFFAYMEVYDRLSAYMTTNLSAQDIVQVMGFRFDSDSLIELPGDITYGAIEGEGGTVIGGHDVFHIDEEALQELIIKMFYVSA
ncbi:MAG: LCP family protein [Lachnospiraceae bacterium]|nr:LCP family protein [Lachnospiraceae bacterium]